MKRVFVIALAAAMAAVVVAWLFRRHAIETGNAEHTPAVQAHAPGTGISPRALADYQYRHTAVETQAVSEFWTRQKPAEVAAPNPDLIPGEYVLSFFDERDRSAFLKLVAARGGTVLGQMDFRHTVRIRMPTRDAFEALLKDGPTPVGRGENFYAKEPRPWGRNKLESDGGYVPFGDRSLAWLGVDSARPNRGQGILLAVLDSGIQAHAALSGARIETVDLLGDGVPVDPHGTAVASLIAGQSDGVQGIAPECSLLSVRVIGQGVGDTFTLAWGIVEAVDRGARVINVCVGSRGDSYILAEAVAYAQQKGAVVVASSGNDAVEGVLYPAAYDGALAVASVDAAGRHAYFSNRGPEVDLAAPGVAVNAAWSNNTVTSFSGTSAATPFVSGALAILLSENPGLSVDDAVALLIRYADDAGDPGRDDEFGNGILDVKRVEERNQRGIYDMAAGDLVVHYPARQGDDMILVLSAQNRGTEEIYHVELTVEFEGIYSRIDYFNVKPGQSVSHQLRLSAARISRAGSIPVSYLAHIDGAEDATPGNNGRRVTVSVGQTPAISF